MRLRLLVIVTLCVAVQLATPAPAQAWWDWLDQLSGPGPFWGWDLQYRVICVADPDSQNADIRLSNIQSGLWKFVARIGGVGCITDETKNPLASFNVGIGQFYSTNNDLQLVKTEGHAHVTMTKFEPSFSVFVDRHKAVEVTTGVGLLLVRGPAFDHFTRYYWKPVQLNITPGAARNVKGPVLGLGVLIIPKGFDTRDFGSTIAFHTDSDVLATLSITYDFARLRR